MAHIFVCSPTSWRTYMHAGSRKLAPLRGQGKVGQILVNLLLSLLISVVSVTTISQPAQSQIGLGLGLGLSLGSMVLSGVASGRPRHQSSHARQNNRAVDAYNRGVKLFEKHEYEKALDEFSEAIEINPNMVEAHWNSAIAYSKLDEYERCLAESLIVMEKRKHDSQASFMAADACQHLHRLVEADQYYQIYLGMDKGGVNAEVANRAVAIIENNFLSKPEGDYLSDATKGGAASWPSNQLPLKVFIKEDASVSGYLPEFSTALRQAFSEWSEVSDGKIGFIFTDKQSEANITCVWIGDKMELGGTKELGLTQTAREGSKIVSATISLYTLADKTELRKNELIAEAKEIDLHEIGHALGLEHSSQPYDTMYFETTPDGLEFALTARDRKTIVALYENSSKAVSQSSDSGIRRSSISSFNGNE
jgi:predicted Zn-dependent protease